MKANSSVSIASVACWLASPSEPRTRFRVKYVAEDAVYLDGGRERRAAEGMKLTVDEDRCTCDRRPARGSPIWRSPPWRRRRRPVQS